MNWWLVYDNAPHHMVPSSCGLLKDSNYNQDSYKLKHNVLSCCDMETCDIGNIKLTWQLLQHWDKKKPWEPCRRQRQLMFVLLLLISGVLAFDNNKKKGWFIYLFIWLSISSPLYSSRASCCISFYCHHLMKVSLNLLYWQETWMMEMHQISIFCFYLFIYLFFWHF